ncbi:hypothetical protein NM688_g3023 [Phlebia brevispora]|uniref:Uncharacterized protein n=1 Tax=Phlebia brevispora TaxID=194682 RepID=A0ACC1T707_9APHY|nr:hypothetical protein NM688_g3023 [Phlebia brevispora]
MLQAQGIIPMPKPSSTNTNGKRPGPDQAGPSKRTRTDDDDPNAEGSNVKPEQDEELEDLLAARAAIEARIREAEGRRVKREASPIVLGAGSGEVIDLTLDD